MKENVNQKNKQTNPNPNPKQNPPHTTLHLIQKWRGLGTCRSSMKLFSRKRTKKRGVGGLTLAPFLMADLQFLLSLAIGKPI